MKLLDSSFENMNEIVFENRNKLYGAYAIRQSYSDRVLTSILFALSAITLLITIPYIIRQYSEPEMIKKFQPDPKWVSIEYTIEKPKVNEELQKEAKKEMPQKPAADKPLTSNLSVTDKKITENTNTTNTDNSTKTTDKAVDDKSGNTGTANGNTTTPPFDSAGYYRDLSPISGTEADSPPMFPGEKDALNKYLGAHIKYPAKARENNITGTVYLSFVIDRDGAVTDIKVLKGVEGDCTEAALKAIESMPNWIPGKYKGHPVKVRMNIPINFKLRN